MNECYYNFKQNLTDCPDEEICIDNTESYTCEIAGNFTTFYDITLFTKPYIRPIMLIKIPLCVS